jgi:hypothetical protein
LSVAATFVSTGVLELVATVGGALLVWSRFLDWASHRYLLGFLAVSYVLWAAALWRNLIANWHLLEATGTSTNVCSKAAYEIVRLRSRSRRAMRVASMGGYVFTEAAKEVPYYAGAFATALVSDSVDSTDALIFLAGTNVGAALYEYGIARVVATYLARRERRTAGALAPTTPAVGAVP